MKTTAAILMILTIVSKFTGFFRDITLSYFYGASNISDAYLVSQLIPMSILEFIGLGLLTGYIPIYNAIQDKCGQEESNDFNNILINLILLISSILICAGLIFTENIVKLFAMGFEGKTLDLAVRFTRVSMFGIYFITLGYVFRGYLQIKGNYVVPAITGIPQNIIIISAIILSANINVMVLALGSLMAIALQLFILVPYAYKEGFRYRFFLDFSNRYLKDLWYLAIPMMIGISVNQINVLVDKTLASQIIEGGISALNYANRLNFFVQGIFVLSISTVMYPTISKMVTENDISGLKRTLREAIGIINILIIPTTIGAVVFANPIVSLLFGRGAFDTEAIIMTSDALKYYSIGMIGYGLREVLSRAFYSMQDTKTPMINAAIGLFLNIFLNILLSKYMGIAGLAFATSISALFTTGLLFISLRKKIGFFGMKNVTISFIKIMVASVIMGAVAKFAYIAFINFISQSLSLMVSVVIGASVYFIAVYFMRIEELDDVVSAARKKLKRDGS